MARLLIRDVDERTVERLKQRAARNSRSLQAEMQIIVERAAAVDMIESRAVAAGIRRRLRDRKHSDSTALIAEDRRR